MIARKETNASHWIFFLGFIASVAWAGSGWMSLQNDALRYPLLHQSLPHGIQVLEESVELQNNWYSQFDMHLGQFYDQIGLGLGLAFSFLLANPVCNLVKLLTKSPAKLRRVFGIIGGPLFVALLMLLSISQTIYYTTILGSSPWWADSIIVPIGNMAISAVFLLPFITIWSALAVYFGKYDDSQTEYLISTGRRIRAELYSLLLTAPLLTFGLLGLTSIFTSTAGIGAIASALFLRQHILLRFSTPD